jgi:hypothetical protein
MLVVGVIGLLHLQQGGLVVAVAVLAQRELMPLLLQ